MVSHSNGTASDPSLPSPRFTPTAEPARVLLAEDDHDLRAFLASKLRGAGYDVLEVGDGGRLLVRLAKSYVTDRPHEAFALIISDLRMPICSGLDIVEGLRKARWSTPAILMTAFGDEATHARAEKARAILFDKPFDVDDLLAVARYLVDRGRSMQ